MDEVRKAVPAEDSAKTVTITKELATISLNPDGKINIAVDRADFFESARSIIDEIIKEGPITCYDKWIRIPCGMLFGLPCGCYGWTLSSIKDLCDKGIININDFNAAQRNALQLVCG